MNVPTCPQHSSSLGGWARPGSVALISPQHHSPPARPGQDSRVPSGRLWDFVLSSAPGGTRAIPYSRHQLVKVTAPGPPWPGTLLSGLGSSSRLLMLVCGAGEEEPRGRDHGPPGRGQLPAAGSCPGLLVQVTLHSATRLPRCPSQCFSLTPELPQPVFRARSLQGRGPVGTGVHGQALQGSWVLVTLSSPESSLRPEPRPLPYGALMSSPAVSLRGAPGRAERLRP